MLARPDVLVESQLPTIPRDWLLRLVLAASLGIVLTAMGFGYLLEPLGIKMTRARILSAWVLVSGVTLILQWFWERRLYFAVSPGSLQIGRSPRETIVEFDEIESIVIGLPLPPKPVWWKRTVHLDFNSWVAHRLATMLRQTAILLRLRGGRHLALNLANPDLPNIPELTATLLRLNQSKVVGADSYTMEEIKALRNVSFNRVRMM